jgi:RNA polymerase sigma-70 factor, ECF subfamily
MAKTLNEPHPQAEPDDPVRAALEDEQLLQSLMGYARKSLKGREYEAQDAVQTAIQRMLERSEKYDPQCGSVAAWLFGILSNVIRDLVRKQQKQPSQQPEQPAVWESCSVAKPEENLSEMREELFKVMNQLPAQDRAILEMRHGDNLSYDEIAQRLGVNAGTARQRVCRALSLAQGLVNTSKGGRS